MNYFDLHALFISYLTKKTQKMTKCANPTPTLSLPPMQTLARLNVRDYFSNTHALHRLDIPNVYPKLDAIRMLN